jgi:hypothetical protein
LINGLNETVKAFQDAGSTSSILVNDITRMSLLYIYALAWRQAMWRMPKQGIMRLSDF